MTENVISNPNASGAGLKCPACQIDLVMSDRQGIEIDYCPRCRGVWLDRGELDKIIERSLAAPVTQQPNQGPSQQGQPPSESYDSGYRGGHGDRGGHGQGHGGGYGGGRRRSWLSDIFH